MEGLHVWAKDAKPQTSSIPATQLHKRRVRLLNRLDLSPADNIWSIMSSTTGRSRARTAEQLEPSIRPEPLLSSAHRLMLKRKHGPFSIFKLQRFSEFQMFRFQVSVLEYFSGSSYFYLLCFQNSTFYIWNKLIISRHCTPTVPWLTWPQTCLFP